MVVEGEGGERCGGEGKRGRREQRGGGGDEDGGGGSDAKPRRTPLADRGAATATVFEPSPWRPLMPHPARGGGELGEGRREGEERPDDEEKRGEGVGGVGEREGGGAGGGGVSRFQLLLRASV